MTKYRAGILSGRICAHRTSSSYSASRAAGEWHVGVRPRTGRHKVSDILSPSPDDLLLQAKKDASGVPSGGLTRRVSSCVVRSREFALPPNSCSSGSANLGNRRPVLAKRCLHLCVVKCHEGPNAYRQADDAAWRETRNHGDNRCRHGESKRFQLLHLQGANKDHHLHDDA